MAMVSMFVILCIVLCAVVVNGGALYYRVGGGQVFGPFEEEQVVAWYRDGYLQTGEVLVSDRPDGSFSPIEQNIVPQNAIVSTPRKRRSLISKLSKKAGSVLSIQRRNLASISKSLAPNFPQYDGVLKREASELTLGGDNIEGMHRAESEDQFLPDSVATSVSDISSERDLTPSSVDDQPCESDEAPTTPMTDEDEQEMLAQLKRDVPSSSESGPLALSSEHGRVHPEESAPQKYSVKSLAKADYSLWDAEDVGAKKSASVDAFLRELETISTQPDTSELSSPPHAAVTMGALNRKRLLKQLNAIVMEILRYLGGIVMKLLPGPLQHCALIVGTLLSAKENHPALVSLLLLNAVSMLRDLLYIALVPAVYALVCSLPGLVTIAAAQSASVIDSKAFCSATAGGIVTAVLDHTTAAGASAAPVSVRRVQAAPGVSASLREVLRFVRSLDRHTAQQAAQAGWQKLQSMRLPGADDVYLVYQQALLRVHGTVLQVASIDKETLTVVLVLASLLLLQSVVLPRLEAHLANTVVVLPNDQQQDCDLEYSADDLATERSTSKPGWVADCESLLQNKVAASPMVRYIRVVSRIVLRLTVCSVLVATVRASLKSVDDRTRSLLLLPLYASVALSAAEFYRQPRPNTHSESRTETMASAPTSSTDRLSYLCDVVSSKRLWAECSRWGLNAYILALLANEQGRVRAHSTSLFDVSGDETAAATTRQRMPLSSVLFRVKVLILSVYVWLQVHASGVFSNGQLDLVRDVYETLRAPHTAGVATWIASMLLLRPVESFQQAVVLLLGRVGKQGKAGADFVVRSTSSLSQQATAARVTSTLCVVLIVLVLPGLLQFGQSALLSEIRPTSPTLTHPPSSTSDVRANVARALLRSHLALTGASSGASGALQGAHGHGHGWSTPGPDPARGIVLEDVTATVGGKAVLRDVSVRLPAGAITVIVSSSPASSTSASALLQLLWDAVSGTAHSIVCSPQQHTGKISVQGRDVQDWNKRALQEQFCFLGAAEEALHIHAGALAGCLPGTTGDALRSALRAQAASGAFGVIAGLPAGPGTVVKPTGGGCDASATGEAQAELTLDQLKALHVSRALCDMQHKPFVLLTASTDGMSEAQERLFFAYLREQLRPGQAVVLTSARLATAAFADHAVLLDERGGVTERDNAEQ